MSKAIYFLGGARRGGGQGGQYVYRYHEEDGSLELRSINYPEMSVGQQCYDADRNISYVVEEIDNQRGAVGGGGYVWALRFLREQEKLELINYRPSMASMPAYVCIDKSKRFAVVVHHGLKHHVTRVVQDPDGSYRTEVIFEEGTIVVFRLNQEGGFEEATDVITIPGDQKPGMRTFCHPHWVGTDPTGELYLVTDCGSDRIFTFHLDRERGKLIPLTTTVVGYGYWPRYAVFHPTLPVFYDSNEMKPVVQGYRYDVQTGNIEMFCEQGMLTEEFKNGVEQHCEPTDILMHPNAKHLYAALRAYNSIAVYDLDDSGAFTLKQVISCGGETPRGLCIAPTGKHLYSLNRDEPNIAGFAIAEDGSLTSLGTIQDHCISSMVSVTFDT